ncbi:hypothetical protein H312_01363, partial [Anncaliia algerae PRA339]
MAKTQSRAVKKARKSAIYSKIKELFNNNPQFLLVNLSYITGNQLQQCKREWKDIAELIVIKNTALKKALKDIKKEDFIESIQGNVALLFLKKGGSFDDFKKLNEIMVTHKRNTVAKTGSYAQDDYIIKPHVTALGADKVSFFQALNIPYKVNKGKLEILSDLKVLTKGTKVGPAHATLLSLLGISPYTYYMKIDNCYDEEFFPSSILSISKDEIKESIKASVDDCRFISLGIDNVNELTVNNFLTNEVNDSVALAKELGLE